MAGTIKKVPGKKNTWEIRYDSPDPITNERRQHKERFNGTKPQADRHLVEIQSLQNRGINTDLGKIPVKQYLEKWMETYCTEANLQYKTRKSYTSIIRKYLIPNLGSIKLMDLKPFHVSDYYTQMCKPIEEGGVGLSPTSVLYHHRILNEALKVMNTSSQIQ